MGEEREAQQMGSLTALLMEWQNGDPSALDSLIPLVYPELRRQARRYLRKERGDHTWQTTALVHETYLRLQSVDKPHWQDRHHFLAVTALMMRRLLIDHARRRVSSRRGGEQQRVDLDENQLTARHQIEELIAVDEVLKKLASVDPRKSQVVELRYFGGLTIEETARALGVVPMTIVREWRMARAWLNRELAENG